MSRASIQFVDIDAPYIHGVKARHGDRTVEVVRAYENEWLIFGKIGGRTIKTCPEIADKYGTKQAAQKVARAFLLGKFTPGVWP